MATLAEIKTAAAEVLTIATGIRAFDYIPEAISPPAAFPSVSNIQEDTYGLGSLSMTLELWVIVPRSRSGQQQLDEYISPTGARSVWQALYDDKTLGLTGTELRIVMFRRLSIEEIAANQYVGGFFECEVTTA